MDEERVDEERRARKEAERAARERRRAGKRFRRALVYYTILPIGLIVSILPLSVARALGWFAGRLAFLFGRRERRLALENLRAAFPELSERELRALCGRTFVHAAVAVADALVIRRWSAARIERRFGLTEDFHDFARALEGEGAVGITAHMGNWELLAVIFARVAPDILVPIANRNANERIQKYLERFREAIGLEVIYTDESPRKMFDALERGKLLGFLPDQDLKTPNGIFPTFFGRPAYTTTLPVNLARKKKSQIVLALLVREGRGFRLVQETGLESWSDDRKADLERNTQSWTKILEREIRTRPEQWMWFHERWRTQPGDEKRMQRVRWTQKTRRKARKAGETKAE